MESDGMFSRILVPTDFSRGSEQAWASARRMARTIGAELVLLHVLPATPLDVEERMREEERRAEVRALQAEHQLGIPRAGDEPRPATHVFEGPLMGATLAEFSDAGRRWAALLEEWADQARADGTKVRTVLRVGVPYREVIEAVKDEEADAIFMATHGRGEIPRLLMGSVADKVIRMAPCPVVTCRER